MVIGPNFWYELQAAGLLGRSFTWTPEGEFFGRENLTNAQNVALDAVIAAHNPNTVPAAVLRQQALLADSQRSDLLDRLQNASPAQIRAYVNSNVTDLASAKVMLIRIMLILAVVANR